MSGPTAVPEPLLDVGQVAEILGVRKRWVYDAAKRGDLPRYDVGRYVRFRASEVEAFIQEQRREGGDGRV